MLRNSSLTANVDAAEVIRAAAGSTLGVLSLGCLIIAVLAFLFFGKDHVWVRLAVFGMVFAAVIGMGIAVFGNADRVTDQAPPPVTSAPIREARPPTPGRVDAEPPPKQEVTRAEPPAARAMPEQVRKVDVIDDYQPVPERRSNIASPRVSAGYNIGGITNVEVAAGLSSLIADLPYEAVISSDDGIESFDLKFGSRDGDALTLKAEYGLSDQHFPSSKAATATIREEADPWICQRLKRYVDAQLASILVNAKVIRSNNMVMTFQYSVACSSLVKR